MQYPGWALVLIGALIAGIGLAWLFAPSIPWLGNLPGDISIKGEHVRIYLPITTCLLLSLVLSGVVWLVRLFTR